MTTLRDGSQTADKRVDRIDDKDPRSLNFPASEWFDDGHYRNPRSYTWRNEVQLDQGLTGACVGFAWTHELTARPSVVEGLNACFAREEVYFRAQRMDRFPGGAYPGALPFSEGTSVVAGAKAIAALGYLEEYRWAFNVDDLVAAVGYRGPAVFGCRWYRGMQEPSPEGIAKPTGPLIGNHCILVLGTKIVTDASGTIDLEASYLKFQNSFGRDWGLHGCATLSLASVRHLWDGAETCIPVVRRRTPRIESSSS